MRSRILKLSALTASLHLDALLLTHLPNVRYFCGFTGSNGTLTLGGGRARFYSDGRYTAQAATEVNGARVKVVQKGGALQQALRDLAPRSGVVRVGFEAEHLSAAAAADLRKLAGARIKLVPMRGPLEAIRMIKEPSEIKLLQAAVNLGSSLMRIPLRKLRPGVTEVAVAAELEYAARKAGADKMSFDSIVAAGKRSGMPHGVASAAPIPAKGFVVLDFGVILAGYCSDMTRTVHVGRASARARQVYGAVLEAQLAAIQAVKPDAEASAVDAAARKVLRQHRLAQYFTHSTGHGVGLEIHEPPRLGAGQSTRLRPGMVITIEPGVYLPGEFGVRIEDMVEVTERGCRIMTPTPKELVEL